MPLRFPGQPLKIAMLDLSPGQPVGTRRHNGFLAGLGVNAAAGPDEPEPATGGPIVCMDYTGGTEIAGREVMAACLKAHPDINVVFTGNELAAAGAYQALKSAGKDKAAMIVSVAGGCDGVRQVQSGVIAATAQQYPLTMAAMGVDAAVAFAKRGIKSSGYVDTGVTLIAEISMPDQPSKNALAGLDACFGAK